MLAQIKHQYAQMLALFDFHVNRKNTNSNFHSEEEKNIQYDVQL